MTRLVGRGVSPGIAEGRALVAVRDARQVRYRLATSGVDRERQRLRAAVERTRRQLEDISDRVARTVGPAQAAIFAAQLLMLDDPLLVRRADDLVRTERINADWALERAIAELRDLFAHGGDAWLGERAGDVADVGGRLQRNLRPGRDPLIDLTHELDPPLILVADELAPSVAAQIDWTRVRGLVCDVGGPTHHTAILVRSLGVPAVVGLGGATRVIGPGQLLAVDGAAGEVAVDPTDELLGAWRRREADVAAGERARDAFKDLPGETADGVRIRLEANLEIADEVERVRAAGAEGIGLYRSDFLLDAAQPGAVDEAAQQRVYERLLAAMRPLPVTIRTFDAAEDRSPLARGSSQRDRFGLRGLRASLQHDERFRAQIRALLRAAPSGTLRVLLPFVTTSAELREARDLIRGEARGLGLTTEIPVGAMIEVPAAAVTVDHLARRADFLSVGSNDLIQYTLAVDRTGQRRGGQDDPIEPAVLRLLRRIVVGAARAGCPLSICGEMAGDPGLASLLVGLGFRAFSTAPASVPLLKQALRLVDSREAAAVARQALRLELADEVRTLLAPFQARWAAERPASSWG